jgi:hypothetical protein
MAPEITPAKLHKAGKRYEKLAYEGYLTIQIKTLSQLLTYQVLSYAVGSEAEFRHHGESRETRESSQRARYLERVVAPFEYASAKHVGGMGVAKSATAQKRW